MGSLGGTQAFGTLISWEGGGYSACFNCISATSCSRRRGKRRSDVGNVDFGRMLTRCKPPNLSNRRFQEMMARSAGGGGAFRGACFRVV